MLLVGCGYRAVYAGPAGELLSVQVGQVLVPDLIAAQAAASAARAELAAAGRLRGESGPSRLLIDVLRVDELSRGVRAQLGQPVARGMSVAVTLRGRIVGPENQEPTLDTGDVRRSAQVAGDAEPGTDSAAYEQALREAAERAGAAVGRLALGIPEPADETP